MSGHTSSTVLGRATGIALATSISLICAGSIQSANAALPLLLGAGGGGVSMLGSNGAQTGPAIPRKRSINLMDAYNSLSAPQRSVLGLLSFGSFGLLAALRPLDDRLKRP